jgi:hypothetical protein
VGRVGNLLKKKLRVEEMALGDYGISALIGKVVDFIYLFVAGLTGYAGDLSSIIVLGLFVTLLVGVAVLMTDSGKKILRDVTSIGKGK